MRSSSAWCEVPLASSNAVYTRTRLLKFEWTIRSKNLCVDRLDSYGLVNRVMDHPAELSGLVG